MKVFRHLGWVLLISLTIPAAQAMPPSPTLLKQIKQKTIQIPYAMSNREELLKRGVDSPHRVKMNQRQVDASGVSTVSGPTSFNSIVLIVDFSDNVSQVTASFFDDLMYGSATSSVNDFYNEVSYGNFGITSSNPPSTIGWITMPQTYAYYVDGMQGFGTYPNNAQKLTEDAVAAADPYVDFSQYDYDGDGSVDGLFIVHAGSGAEFTGSYNDIWSHKWSTYNPPTVDGVTMNVYSMEPEFWASPGDMTIGVYAHEMGHSIFGLPDLYDTDYSSEGLGAWSLMAGGSWNGILGDSPAHPDAWCRMQMGFLTPQNVVTPMPGVTITPVEDSPVSYRLWQNGDAGTEYFLIENRQQTGFDSGLPGSGLLVYHVDESVMDDNDDEWYPGYTDYGHYLVALEQADGNWDLETYMNSGDSGDPFPGSTANTAFDDMSMPDSRDYSFNPTNVSIDNISVASSDIVADFSVFESDPSIPDNLVAGDGFDKMVPLTWDPPPGFAEFYTGGLESPSFEARNSKRTASDAASLAPSLIAALDTVGYYNIYRGTASGGPYSLVTSVDPTGRPYDDNDDYIDDGLTNGTTYYYVITVVDIHGVEGGYSAEVMATPVEGGIVENIDFALNTPTIDGSIEVSEWIDATAGDITSPGAPAPVHLFMKNDANYLYIAVDDENNTTDSDYNEVGIYFDDDNSGTWDPDTPSSEGNFWITLDGGVPGVSWRPIYGAYPDGITFEAATDDPTGVVAAVSASSGHLQYEIQIDLAASPFTASIGDTVRMQVYSYDGSTEVTTYYGDTGDWPYGPVWIAPSTYGKVVLGLTPEPPAIAVTPDSLSADLLAGETSNQTLTLDNSEGIGDLNYIITFSEANPIVTAPIHDSMASRKSALTLASDSRNSSGNIRRAGIANTPVAHAVQQPTLNTTRPTASAPATSGTYSGANLYFEISDYGEVIPFQYPVGNEHLLAGFYGSGYTLAYMVSDVDNVALAGYDERFGITPVSYTELENDATHVVVEVVTKTSDNALQIKRTFSFNKSDKFVRIQTSIQNISGGPVDNVVFKSWADWDMNDGYEYDNWDYDFGRNMVYAWESVYAAIASLETPDIMDIDGWGDYEYRDTYVDFPTGPVMDYDGLEILHFNLGNFAASQQRSLTTAFGAGDDLMDLQAVMDRALLSNWLDVSPMLGVVPAGSSFDLSVLFDATQMPGGDYDRHIVISSNDPVNPEITVPAHMHVTGTPNIVALPMELIFDQAYVGIPKVMMLTVKNTGSEMLTVGDIISDNESFSVDHDNFTVPPYGEEMVQVSFNAATPAHYAGQLTLNSDDPDTPALGVPLSGDAEIAPILSVNPTSFASVVYLEESPIDEQTLTINNPSAGGTLSVEIGVGGVFDEGGDILTSSRKILERHKQNLLQSSSARGNRQIVLNKNHAHAGVRPGDVSTAPARKTKSLIDIPLGDWQMYPDMNLERSQLGLAASQDGEIFAFGGSAYEEYETNSLEVFDPYEGYWWYGPDMANPVRGQASAMGSDGRIYSFSVFGEPSMVYNPEMEVWSVISDPPLGPVWEGGAARAVNGLIYVIGGEADFGEDYAACDFVQIYNPVTNSWSTGSPMPTARMQLGVVAGPGGMIYAIGGITDPDLGPVGTVEIYDPISDTWSSGAPMPTPRNQFAIATAPDGKIYTIGGKQSYYNYDGPFYDDVEIYNPFSDSWDTGSPLPFGIGEMEAVTVGGAIHVVGGVTDEALLSTHFVLEGLGVDWLTVTPQTAELDPGNSMDFAVQFDASGLRPGQYSTVLTIRSNDPVHPAVDLPVDFRVLTDNVMPPVVSSVEDVPGDQGGWVFANWNASEDDRIGSAHPVAYYSVWLKNPFFENPEGASSIQIAQLKEMITSISVKPASKTTQRIVDVSALKGTAKSESGKQVVSMKSAANDTKAGKSGKLLIDGEAAGGRVVGADDGSIRSLNILTPDLIKAMNTGQEWIGIGSIPATRDAAYSFLVHTLQDSNAVGTNPSFIKVAAHGTDPFLFAFSDEVSGYSVDNIAPGTPVSVAGTLEDGGIRLSWSFDFGALEDFQYFAIYRGTDPIFEPESMDSVTYATSDTFFVDADIAGSDHYVYRIAAVDYCGNHSVLTEPLVMSTSSVGDGLAGVPDRFALKNSYPNPFNSSTTVRFDVPVASQVSLIVYDILGREVTRLTDSSMQPGRHMVVWNGLNGAGAPVSTGIYIVRMSAPGYTHQMKMVLIR